MIDHLLETTKYLGLFISLGAFMIGLKLNKKYPYAFMNPLLIGTILVIGLILGLDIEVANFQKSAQILSDLLTPATICLAVPVYRQFKILRENSWVVLISCLAGMISGLVTIIGWALILQMSEITTLSTLARSITMAIALDTTELIGGVAGIIVAGVIFAGIFGTVVSSMIFRIFRIEEPIAKGLALGAASHAMGTAESLKSSELQGAMSSLAMVVSGVVMVGLIPLAALFVQ
ncbi:LrgB family protein [uncultured Trichococcus sp.]|uniref:LrgB family protein n=1 Tax=uncultured Trichococcus sp. TaxID=189665 RepID=UPI002A18CBE0|nr:LrgB family protein [uncultured Trichococcus sp.]